MRRYGHGAINELTCSVDRMKNRKYQHGVCRDKRRLPYMEICARNDVFFSSSPYLVM